MFCFKCGASTPGTAATCPQCGAALTPVAARAASAPAPAPAPPGPRLNVPQMQPYVGQPETDGKALGSLILGILSIFPFGLLAGIPAIILGHISYSNISKSMGRLKGQGMAVAGLIMGYLSIVLIPVVLIIAAIAIPSLLRARIMANQSAAASTVRTLNTAQVSYSDAYPDLGYAQSLTVMGPGQPPVDCTDRANLTAQHACLLDSVLGCSSETWCSRTGYKFNLTAACAVGAKCEDYAITATPITSTTGKDSFCSTSDLVIRYNAGPPLTAPVSSTECQSWPAVGS
jgi:type IV pilus assembly protein PilA